MDLATVPCFLLHQLVVESVTLKTYPDVECWLSVSPAQSASEKPTYGHTAQFCVMDIPGMECIFLVDQPFQVFLHKESFSLILMWFMFMFMAVLFWCMWDWISACKGATSSRNQCIVDLTHPTYTWIWRCPTLLQIVCGFFNVRLICMANQVN